MSNPDRHVPRGCSGPLWLALLTSLAGLLLLGSRLLIDPDIYMHIATGYWILEHRAVPVVDSFSYTMSGQPWVPHEWLAQSLMACLHRELGWTGLILMAVASLALTLAIVLRFLLDRLPPVYALLFTVLMAATLATHLLARPHVLAWPLLAIWAGTLLQAAEQGRSPPWRLAGVMVLWANLHGSFTLGLALVPVLAAEAVWHQSRDVRRGMALRWGAFGALALAAALLTPYGWKGLWFTLHLTGLQYLHTINEWQPASHWLSLLPLELWVLMLLGLGLTGWLRLPPVRLLLLAGLIHQAMQAGRYISVLGLLTPLIIAAPFGAAYSSRAPGQPAVTALDDFFDSLRARARLRTVAAAALLVLLAAWGMKGSAWHAPDISRQPIAAIEAAQAAGLQRRVFNASQFGGFLIFRGIPVFIDGRADLYGDRLMGQYFEQVVYGTPASMQSLLDEYGVEWTLLPPDSRLQIYLSLRPDWRKVYEDGVAVVHRRLR